MRIVLILLLALNSVSCLAGSFNKEEPVPLTAVFNGRLQHVQILPFQQQLISVTVENQGQDDILLNDPKSVSDAVKLTLMSEQHSKSVSIVSNSHSSSSNVPYVPRKIRVSPHRSYVFEIDLQRYFQLNKPGNYSLTIEYQWDGENVWQSTDYNFTLVTRPIIAVGTVPNDSTENGYHGLFWLHQGKLDSTMLIQHWRLQDQFVALPGASAQQHIPADADVTLSMQPAGDPLLERWLVSLVDTSLSARYLANNETRSISVATEVPVSSSLIKPALASFAPNEGRPSLAIGLIAQDATYSHFHYIEVSPSGKFKTRSHVDLAGTVEDSWALSDQNGVNHFFFWIQDQQNNRLYQIDCIGTQTCSTAKLVLAAKDQILAGDLRLLNDNTLVFAGIFEQSGNWVRKLFTQNENTSFSLSYQDVLEIRGETPSTQSIKVDNSGRIHTLYHNQSGLYYTEHGKQTSRWRLPDELLASRQYELVLLSNNKVQLVYQHSLRGLVVEEL